MLSEVDAIELTGIRHQQVSRWAKGLKDQAEFVAWWRATVQAQESAGRHNSPLTKSSAADSV
jgi:hypothetical protein